MGVSGAVPFPVWGLANSGLPYAGAKIDEPRLVADEPMSVTVAYGRSGDMFRGPAAVAVTYNPRALVQSPVGAAALKYRTLWSSFGLLDMAADTLTRFALMMAHRHGVDVDKVRVSDPDHLRQFFKVAGGLLDIDGLVPALAFRLIALPEATVVVSADLLAHPVVVAGWQCELLPYPRLLPYLWEEVTDGVGSR